MARLGTCKANAKWTANIRALCENGRATKASELSSVRVETLDSMADVRRLDSERFAFCGKSARLRDYHERVQARCIEGDRAAADNALDQSNALIDNAIALDSRLARRPCWERSEDGVFADAGLVASGDDSPCFDMRRRSLRDAAACGEPVNVVISTDSSTPANLAAVIATIRIVQQFRPVHVWWQGAWLADDGRDVGYVFLAPLVQGDMDYARLAYVIGDYTRDSASFSALHQLAYVRDRVSPQGLGRPADRAYLYDVPDVRYVSRDGIAADAETIAETACRWLGIDTLWTVQYREHAQQTAAVQEIPREYHDTRTAAQRAADEKRSREYWEQRDREDAEKRRQAAASRLATIA